MSAPIDFVDDPAQLEAALASIEDTIIGVDVERADSDLYHRRAALVQVGDAGRCILVDPLAIPEPTSLATLCADRLVVLHAIENDLDPMESLGVLLPRAADTAIAAALLNLPTGLGDLLTTVLGVDLDTDKSKYQRADWSRRPLSTGMMEYAAGDVLHLPALWRELESRLHEIDRFGWYEQELEATIAGTRVSTRHWEKVKGSGRLSPEQRAVLHAVWVERESLCVEHDIAPNRLIHDKTMLGLAQKPAEDADALVARDPQRRRGPVIDHADALFAAQQRGLEAEPEPRSASKRWSDEQRDAFDALRDRRAVIAESLGLDAGFACASRHLRAAVAAQPETAEELADAAGFRPWQREQLLDELWSVYVEAMTPPMASDDSSDSSDSDDSSDDDVPAVGDDDETAA